MSLLVSYMCILESETCIQGGQIQFFLRTSFLYLVICSQFVCISIYKVHVVQLNITFGVLHVYIGNKIMYTGCSKTHLCRISFLYYAIC